VVLERFSSYRKLMNNSIICMAWDMMSFLKAEKVCCGEEASKIDLALVDVMRNQ
jgi:hypothetical protein